MSVRFPIKRVQLQKFIANKTILLFLFVFISFFTKGQELQYPPPAPGWQTDSLGNRRAVVQVGSDAEAVLANIEWRRSDTLYKNNAIYVVDGKTGNQIENVYRKSLTATTGEIIFEPVSGQGIYYIYYMPYRLT